MSHHGARDVHSSVRDRHARRSRRMRPFLSLLAVAGCGMGGMKQATILRDCSGGDAACLRLGPLAPLAVGAVFQPRVDTQLPGTTTPTLGFTTADPAIVDVE